jgi:hypothetical protein
VSENRQIMIASLPHGALQASDFELRTSSVPEAGEGEALCRTLAITIGAGQRAGLQGSASYAGAAKTDTLMGGNGVARVEASNASGFSVGDLVVGPTGWQDYAALSGRHLTKIEPAAEPALHLGALGTNGLTAYFGLLEVGQARAGETVVVSAAAGSVGHAVGQIAKLKGCTVVGVAGSVEKCKILVDELGFDRAVDYKGPDFRAAFKAATASRIDVYFDTTGGDVLPLATTRLGPSFPPGSRADSSSRASRSSTASRKPAQHSSSCWRDARWARRSFASPNEASGWGGGGPPRMGLVGTATCPAGAVACGDALMGVSEWMAYIPKLNTRGEALRGECLPSRFRRGPIRAPTPAGARRSRRRATSPRRARERG